MKAFRMAIAFAVAEPQDKILSAVSKSTQDVIAVQDIKLMKTLGIKAFRMSIAWPRIQPQGTGPPNQAGLKFYGAVFDALIAEGIEPWVTLYHWDLPQVGIYRMAQFGDTHTETAVSRIVLPLASVSTMQPRQLRRLKNSLCLPLLLPPPTLPPPTPAPPSHPSYLQCDKPVVAQSGICGVPHIK